MSDIDIYDVSVGTYMAGVTSLVNILKKAALQPDADTLPSAKLIDDMQPLSFQVQSVSNTVSKSLKWVIGTEVESWEDNETTMEQLIERVEKTLAMLKSIDPKALEGRESAEIKLSHGTFTGKQFIFSFGMPSFFFHLQTAYAILRMKGVQIGKADYMDSFKGSWDHS
ncbi:uncharacterized protein LY89DRAFT_168 [Mollisia scopiformis]|uniref:DUF1993 domain-containing protein n=1 Tax=Mollisia scopiformis TaxID=149040 RepID=A0A194XU66_MOLSC|nr:uncharacterized protein LY89DRAFT_168 [Mollisia scopiformis]KUJ23681.1 hypothetical protein LY89DRAFT_168 [Mollisia scopiformis]